MDFYRGNVLRIDLTARAVSVEPLNMEWAERYIGGKGLLLRYLWTEVPPKVDPWAPENPIIHEHPEREVAYKCDLCDGEPQCIAFCQNPTSWPST